MTDLRTLKGWDIRPDHAKVVLYFCERGDVELGGAGVLITGSVVTAGEARLLLKGGGDG